MKRLILLLSFLMMVGCIIAQPTSGKCGKNVTWTLQDDGTLVISGAGDTYDYSKKPQNSPFVKNGIVDRIRVVDLTRFHTDGHLSDNLFYRCKYVELVMLSEEQLLSLNTSLFNDSHQLKKVIVCCTINPSKNNYRIMTNNLPNRKDSLFPGATSYFISKTSDKFHKKLSPIEKFPTIEDFNNIKERKIFNGLNSGKCLYQKTTPFYWNGEWCLESFMQFNWSNKNWLKGKFEVREKKLKNLKWGGERYFWGTAKIIEYHWNNAPRKGDCYIGSIKGSQYHMQETHDWSFSKKDYSDFYAEGYGEYHWANGDWYMGDWVNGKREGYGEMYWKRIGKYGSTWYDTYYGEWHNDKMIGFGKEKTYHYEYAGPYKNEKFHGRGVFHKIVDGGAPIFYGDFVQGKNMGKGIEIDWGYIQNKDYGNGTIIDSNFNIIVRYGLWDDFVYKGHPETITLQDFLDAPNMRDFISDFPTATIPFSIIAKFHIEREINEWQKKGEFETTAEWQSRVTEATRQQKINELLIQLQDLYLESTAKKIQHHLKLGAYDADHQTYIITDSIYENQFAPMIVSLDNNITPQAFKASWDKIIPVPTYFLNGNNIDIWEMDFMLYDEINNDYKRVAHYQKAANLIYNNLNINYQFAPIAIPQGEQMNGNGNVTTVDVSIGKPNPELTFPSSDVDINIPVVNKKNNNTFVFIIANENYSAVANVPFALNDGNAFKEYCVKTLGVNENRVTYYKDATFGQMTECVELIKQKAKVYKGDATIIFYYAGHAFPDGASQARHLLPVDGNSRIPSTTYSLKNLYSELGDLPVKKVICFIDACFSGATRDDGMLMADRGVVLQRAEVPQGNLVVFTAADSIGTAHQYSDKSHGMFTYFLLKKLQDTKGDVSLKDLSDYVIDNVRKTSIDVNMKLQNPIIKISPAMRNEWQDIKLNE